MNNALTAVLLGGLIKTHVAEQIESLLNSRNVIKPVHTRCAFEVWVYGDTKEELIENRRRCRDAAQVFGVATKARKLFKTGETIERVDYTPAYLGTKHYFSKVFVTYL